MAETVSRILGKKETDYVTKEDLQQIKEIDAPVNETQNMFGIGHLTELREVGSCKNYVTEIPPEIKELKKLESLDLCKSYSIGKIPEEIGECKNLKHMRLYLTSISELPRSIGNLENLEYLYCNYGTKLPREIGKLSKLKELACEGTNIPKELSQLENLQYLNARSCDVSDFIQDIGKLQQLTRLHLGECELKEFPKDILKLKNLRNLNLFGNDIRYIPKEIGNMINLESINTYDNYNLDEDYEKYLPKRYFYSRKVNLKGDISIGLPENFNQADRNVTFQLKELNRRKYQVKKEKDEFEDVDVELMDNHVIINSKYIPKNGNYTFRIIKENKQSYPRYILYTWNLDVQRNSKVIFEK